MSMHAPVPPGALPSGAPPAEYPSSPPLAAPASPVPPGSVRSDSTWPAGGGAPPTGDGSRRPPWIVALGVSIGLALVGGVVAADIEAADPVDQVRPADPAPGPGPTETDREPPLPPPRPPPTPSQPDPAPDLEQIITEIAAFVEAERGLRFVVDVEVQVLDDRRFRARLLEGFDADADELATTGRVLTAFGLLEPGTDLVEDVRALLGSSVGGFYDGETDELVVRGGEPTPHVRAVIAHELTHALDDQYFELDRPELDEAVHESGFAFTALVEGNASRVEDAYRSTFTPEEEREALIEELALSNPTDVFDVQPVVVAQLSAPDVLGPDLVAALLADGGQSRLDEAFEVPPVSSEQVLEPGRFLDGEGVVEVAAPVADGPVIDEGSFGALLLAELIGESVVAFPGLHRAVAGWGGDRYVAWDAPGGGGTCVRLAIMGDTPKDTTEILTELGSWAASAPFGVTAAVEGVPDGSGAVTLTSCSA